MINKIFRWIDQHKTEDTMLIQFLKLGYSIGQKAWIHTSLSAILGILVPILFDNKKYLLFVLFLVLMLLDIFFVHVCNEYYQLSYLKRKFAHEILADQSSLLKSVLIEIENNNNWKSKIFRTVSDLVCEKIYQNFKEVFNCETRVSVEYVFNKCNNNNTQKEKHIKMSGRRSNKRATVKKSVAFEKRKKYYSYKIFASNNSGVNILSEDKINDSSIWYKDPNHMTDVRKYVGIAVNVYDESEVKFILEIDFIDDFTFGENNDEMDIKKFIEDYLTAYINLISISYLLNLNNKKEIPEV